MNSLFQSRVKAVKERLDPIEFYEKQLDCCNISQHYCKGWRQAGLCPFHNDTKEGSFYINQNSGAFKCFSCGAKGGDIISFLQKRDALRFNEALRLLENEGGIR